MKPQFAYSIMFSLAIFATSAARATTLATIPEGSQFQFKGNQGAEINIRPGIKALYWQNGRMVEEVILNQKGTYCSIKFEASNQDRAMKPGITFEIEGRNPYDSSLTLGRANSTAKVSLSCFTVVEAERTGVVAPTRPQVKTAAAKDLSIAEFERVVGGSFEFKASATVDFKFAYPKPPAGDQRIFDEKKIRGAMVMHQEIKLDRSYQKHSSFSELPFAHGKINPPVKAGDVLCYLRNHEDGTYPAGTRAKTDDDPTRGGYFWTSGGDRDLLTLDCMRLEFRSYDNSLDEDHDDPPTIAEVQKAFGSIISIVVTSIDGEK